MKIAKKDTSKRPVYLQDIADRAGVSRSAVSLALRNSPRVSAAATAKIVRLAAQMGYRPNPLLRAHMSQLRLGRAPKFQGGLAFVSNFSPSQMSQAHSPEREIYTSGKARAESLGYHLEFLFHDRNALSESRLDGILWSRNVAGVIVGPMVLPAADLQLDWSRYASVMWGYSLSKPPLHRVTHDYYNAVLTILDNLQRMGYRKIGFCTHKYEDVRTNHFSIAAYLYHQHLLPKNRRVDYLATPGPVWDEELLMEWYRRNRPNAIICTNPGAYEILKRNGVRIPEDVGFAVSTSEPEWPSVSGIRYDFEGIGFSLVDMVVGQLNRNERGVPTRPVTVQIPGIWVPAKTLANVG